MFVDAAHKKAALLALRRAPEIGLAVVFTLQKNIAHEVCAFITAAGITAEALHGNKSQGQRERALAAFRRRRAGAGGDRHRGPRHRRRHRHACLQPRPASLPESYVHRIGRTGRAITLCDAEQRAALRDVERDTGRTLTVRADHKWHSEAARNSTMRPPVRGGFPVRQIKPPP